MLICFTYVDDMIMLWIFSKKKEKEGWSGQPKVLLEKRLSALYFYFYLLNVVKTICHIHPTFIYLFFNERKLYHT